MAGGGLDPAMMAGLDPNMLAGLLGGKGGGGKGGGKGGGAPPDPAQLAQIWDNPMVANVAFHPSKAQPDYMDATSGPVRDGVFEVSGGDKVSYRLYLPTGDVKVVVYFWHGNAEVCTACDHIASVFHGCNAAVLSLDYRGYSWGTGQPSLAKLCDDAEASFAASLPVLEKAGCGGAKLVAMGRSIGATCAVHVASTRASKFHGLVVDSGLMSVKGLPMVSSMGPMLLGGPDNFKLLPEPFDTFGKLSAISCPLLVMHGKRDEIVPFAQASKCHETCASRDKVFKEWENAGHNDVGLHYEAEWSQAVTQLLGKAAAFTEPLPAGASVEAHSLSAAELNGLQGRIIGPQADRYRVQFPDPTGEKALKADNLKFLAASSAEAVDAFPIGMNVEAHSLSNADFNGLKGKVISYKGERVNVAFPDGAKALKPANLKPL